MVSVTNPGLDANWCGHHFCQSNWYAFGRLAWNPDLPAARIADAVDGGTRALGEAKPAGDPKRNHTLGAADAHFAVTLSILVPDGTDLAVLAARSARHPAAAVARVARLPA